MISRFLFCNAFPCCLLRMFCSILQCFSSLKLWPSLLPWLSHCVHLKVLQVGSFLLPLSLLKHFIFYWRSDLRSSPYFAANIVKGSDDLAYQLYFVFWSLKLFCICNEAVWFWVQSDLSWKSHPLRWKYSLLSFWNKFETNMLRICAYLSLAYSKLIPS